MPGRPSRTAIALELLALAAAVAVAIWRAPMGDWDIAVLIVLLGLSITADLSAFDSVASRIKVSASFLAVVVGAVILGSAAGALIGAVTMFASWLRFRWPLHDLLINTIAYTWAPLAAGVGMHAGADAIGVTPDDALYYLLVFGAFCVAIVVDFTAIASFSSYLEGSRFWTKMRRILIPILPSELVSAVLVVGFTLMYFEAGVAAIALLGVALVVFQYLSGALLISQQRADELELQTKRLAGFQVALLSALLRTLDLRDRMTARHSAAVARYAREIAIAAGLSEEEQELAHTAGLLHDIGKFVFPDRLLSGNTKLTEEDWQIIRKHPYEGARIVSQVDGYQPVSEIILAHHERIDGLGYPRGLRAEEIPLVARIISVADTYDVMTARDSYREPVSSFEAIEELRRVSGTQLDGRFVDTFIQILADKDIAYRHGEDADFDRELALDTRVHDQVTRTTAKIAEANLS
jgi:putative nucleotidyltransferase with HDIG domain